MRRAGPCLSFAAALLCAAPVPAQEKQPESCDDCPAQDAAPRRFTAI